MSLPPNCDLAGSCGFLRDNRSNDLNQSVRDAFEDSPVLVVLLNDSERFVVEGLDFGVDNRRRLAMSGTWRIGEKVRHKYSYKLRSWYNL